MDYIVMGGDRRFAHLTRLLAEQGKEVGAFGMDAWAGTRVVDEAALRQADNLVVNYPPKLAPPDRTFEEILAAAGRDARVFACGPWHPAKTDDRIVDLWADEALLRENARLTAEGAISSAMAASEEALSDLRCMVIGWGRIGMALTEQLVALGARVTVASRSGTSRNRAVERGAEAVETRRIAEALPGHRLIYNTAPCMVLDETALRQVERDAMLIELASSPYGIDLTCAWKLGLRAWREPGLPGRYCPRSAAKALLRAMERCGL